MYIHIFLLSILKAHVKMQYQMDKCEMLWNGSYKYLNLLRICECDGK